MVDITKIKSDQSKWGTKESPWTYQGLSMQSKFGKLTLSSKDQTEEQLKLEPSLKKTIHPPSAGGFNDFGSRNKPPVELSSSEVMMIVLLMK